MRMKKFGMIALALTLCLAMTGAAFAAWTDTLTIKGTVNTGSVDLNVEEVSSTYVSKDPGTGAVVVTQGWEPLTPPANVIASAVAVIDSPPADDNVTVTMTNLFPCVDFKVDFLIHYDGSVPAKLNITDPLFTGTDAAFFNDLVWSLPTGNPEDSYCYGEMWVSDEYGNTYENIPDMESYQVHYCDYILIVITLHLGQAAPMNAEASFNTTINAIQWNEYEPPQ